MERFFSSVRPRVPSQVAGEGEHFAAEIADHWGDCSCGLRTQNLTVLPSHGNKHHVARTDDVTG